MGKSRENDTGSAGLLISRVLGGAPDDVLAIVKVNIPHVNRGNTHTARTRSQERYKKSLTGEDEERGPVFEWLAQPEDMVRTVKGYVCYSRLRTGESFSHYLKLQDARSEPLRVSCGSL